MNARHKSKRFWFACIIGGVLILSVVVQIGYSPLSLRRTQWYMWTSPGFFRYCLIRKGDTRTAVISRLGKPTIELAPNTTYWTNYRAARDRAGWSKPPCVACDNIMIYEDEHDFDMIVVYIFMKQNRVIQIFISET